MANSESYIFLSGDVIPNGLPIKAMRHLIENTHTLSYPGDIYIGTGDLLSVSVLDSIYTYYSTTHLLSEPGASNTVLCYDSSLGYSYRYLNRDDFAADALSIWSIASDIILNSNAINTQITLNSDQFNADDIYPYGAALGIEVIVVNGTSAAVEIGGTYLCLGGESIADYRMSNYGIFQVPTSDMLSYTSLACIGKMITSTSSIYGAYFQYQNDQMYITMASPYHIKRLIRLS